MSRPRADRHQVRAPVIDRRITFDGVDRTEPNVQQRSVVASGDSLAITIPDFAVRLHGIEAGDRLDIKTTQDGILIVTEED